MPKEYGSVPSLSRPPPPGSSSTAVPPWASSAFGSATPSFVSTFPVSMARAHYPFCLQGPFRSPLLISIPFFLYEQCLGLKRSQPQWTWLPCLRGFCHTLFSRLALPALPSCSVAGRLCCQTPQQDGQCPERWKLILFFWVHSVLSVPVNPH